MDPTTTPPARLPLSDAECLPAVTDLAPAGTDELVEADDLVEEVSIDGMCGVY